MRCACSRGRSRSTRSRRWRGRCASGTGTRSRSGSPMSITSSVRIACAGCGLPLAIDVVDSLNAERHPHLRQQVLDRRLHAARCTCGRTAVLERELLYVDLGRRQVLGVFPPDERRAPPAGPRPGAAGPPGWGWPPAPAPGRGAGARGPRAPEACARRIAAAHERWFCTDAPAWVRELGTRCLVRACFGLEELREKLVGDDAGLDDLAVEIAKGIVLARASQLRAAEVAALRL